MKIKKIAIKGNGFAGLHITHLIQEKDTKGRLFINERTDKRKQPIHLGLENKFKELRPFYLELCRILRGDEDKATKDYTIQETEITGLQIVIDTTEDEGTGFIIEGCIGSVGDKYIKPKTAKIESGDGYHNFDAVQLIIKEIVEEVRAYANGSVVASDSEVLIRYMERNKEEGIEIEAIKNMSADEQKELLTSILEKKFGMVVLDNDNLIVDEDTDITEDLIGGKSEEIKEETFTLNAETNVIPITLTPSPELKKA